MAPACSSSLRARGCASFFSPCSFPLLVTMLARPLAERAAAARHRPLRDAVRFASALSLGAAAFLIAIGSVIALIGGGLFAGLTFTSTAGRVIRFVVGLLLIALGLIQLGRLPVNLRRFEPALHGYLGRQARVRRERPLGFALFGFGSCSPALVERGPALVGLTGQAFTPGGGFGAAFFAFAVAAIALMLLMFALAVALAAAQEETVRSMREDAPAVKRWGGRILVAVGSGSWRSPSSLTSSRTSSRCRRSWRWHTHQCVRSWPRD